MNDGVITVYSSTAASQAALDVATFSGATGAVSRERIQIGGATFAALASVSSAAVPDGGAAVYGLVVRPMMPTDGTSAAVLTTSAPATASAGQVVRPIGFSDYAGADMTDSTLHALRVALATQLDSTNDTIGAEGIAALDGPLSSRKPLPVGARASTATPTAVDTDGDSVWLWSDRVGRLFVRPQATQSAYYGPQNQAVTITLNGLSAADATRSSTVINNAETLFEDILFFASIAIATAPTSSQAVYLYCYGSIDGGVTYTDNVSGSDAVLTTGVRNAPLLGVVSVTSPNVVMRAGPFSARAAFGLPGGTPIPQRLGVIALNSTGTYLSNANSNANVITWQGVQTRLV